MRKLENCHIHEIVSGWLSKRAGLSGITRITIYSEGKGIQDVFGSYPVVLAPFIEKLSFLH